MWIFSRHFKQSSFSKSRRNGFSLVEVMAALMVIAIALPAIYKMHSQTLFMEGISRFDTISPVLASMKLAEIETSNLKDQGDDSGDFGDQHPGYAWSVLMEDVESETLKSDGPILKKITVRISRNNDDNSFSLTTYRATYE